MTVPATSLSQRQQNEARVYDERAASLDAALSDDELLLDASHPPYPNREHVAFLDELFARIGPLQGRRVLEIGCGSGALSVYAALQGADVHGVDVSEPMLRLARRRAEVNGVAARATFVASPAERCEEPDGSFDVVLANQVLHHLELDDAMANVARLLRRDGVALFVEPVLFMPEPLRRLRYHPLVLRRFPSRQDTPDERSLNQADLEQLVRSFGRVRVDRFQATTRLQNFFDLSDRAFSTLERVDRVLHRLPGTAPLTRYVLIELRWPHAAAHPDRASAPLDPTAARSGGNRP